MKAIVILLAAFGALHVVVYIYSIVFYRWLGKNEWDGGESIDEYQERMRKNILE